MSSDIKNNSVHLCNSCSYDYPDCPSEEYMFGDGVGNDNICCCGSYDPLWTKETYTIHMHEKWMNELFGEKKDNE